MLKYITVLLLLIFSACASPNITLFPDTRDALQEFALEGEGKDKILIIPVEGIISHQSTTEFMQTTPSTVQEVVAHLKLAEEDPQIKAVLLKIDSPGGSSTASDLLYHEILAFKERTEKPIVAVMMDLAASGGYYVALAADAIIAHPTTITGSVGVIFVRPQFDELSQKIGIGVAISKSGINKDMGSPFRQETDAEKEIFQKITDKLGQRFINLVTEHRHVSTKQREKIATARIFTADQALELGMIDEIGYLSDAVEQTKEMADLPSDAKVVVYRRSEFKDDNIYNIATQSFSGPSSLSQLNRLTRMVAPQPGFYYMWLPGQTSP
jgi:protease-4